MEKDWELYAIEKDFLKNLAKQAEEKHGYKDEKAFWEIQGQELANKACQERGFDTYTDIGEWVKHVFDKDQWSMPKPHLHDGIVEAQCKYSFMGEEYKFYLLWNRVR